MIIGLRFKMKTTTLILLMSLLVFAKKGSSVTSFNFSSFNQTTSGITVEKDAVLSRNSLELTTNQLNTFLGYSYGRASYQYPLQLWDRRTGRLTDFDTHFTFSIREISNGSISGDGMAFFLAPFNSTIPDDSSGGALGLSLPAPWHLNKSVNHFVAVEFDTFWNVDWDPSSNHVGIDINSIESETTMSWKDDSMKNGTIGSAWVNYNSTSRNLSVFLTYDQNPVFSLDYYILSFEVDLRDYLPERVRVGFSAATGAFMQTHTVYSWSFNSTLDLIDENTNAIAPSPPPSVETVIPGEGKGINGLAIGLAVGFGVLLICGLGALWFVCCRKRRVKEIEEEQEREEEDDMSIDGEFERGAGPKRFTYHELRLATGDFDEEGKLGEGGFGGVYKGLLCESNMEVAVKRISKGSKQGKKEYVSEVTIISRLRHRNLVQLIGWCHTKGEFLLVYEFMPNRSLDTHLFKRQQTLTWSVRNKIAHGLASALLYLHEEWEQCVVHRDIKSSNVMLDSNFNAKLGDFGLARFADHESGLQTTILAGTMGYMAPECVTTGKASKESDVYSFGVVALEICCGRRPIERHEDPRKVSLVEWVWDLYGTGQVLEAADTRLSMEFDEQQMERLMAVGLWCCHPDPSFRPSIKQVVSILNFEAPLPNLPSKLPRPMYFAPPLDINSSFYTSSTASGSYFTDSSKSESQSIPLKMFSQTEM